MSLVDDFGGNAVLSETTEDEHAHYCEMCGGVWTHEDEGCVGPRWTGRMYWGSTWDCPRCAGDGR